MPSRRAGPAQVAGQVAAAPDEATIRGAIDSITRALAMAADEAIPELVSERAAMRRELAELRQVDAGVVRLEDERARRGRRR